MPDLIIHRRPELNRPILIAAFAGWNDAGHSATSAAQHLVQAWGAEKFAEIDPEEFFDFTSTRPMVRLVGNARRIEWPEIAFYAARDRQSGIDAILLIGPEPSVRWGRFSQQIVELAQSLNVSLAVTLGAYLGGGTHLDPIPLSGWASPETLRTRLRSLDVDAVAYEGPTGIVTVLGHSLADAGVATAAVWAAVPAYLGRIPNPKGNLALVSLLNQALSLNLDLSSLQQTVRRFDARVSEVVRQVRRESGTRLLPAGPEGGESPGASPESGPASPRELPPSDEVIRDVEEFFRRMRGS